ncbi:MAG: hypothetical protein O2967_16445 [Proteobacteria bacterium]|nr:hypothetical protein [Pseudomonadota bacterium]
MALIKKNELSKGHLRKLTALRKSLGDAIADEAFAKWHAALPAKKNAQVDKNIQAMTDLVTPAVLNGSIRLPRGGYVIRRGRGKVIVERTS